MKKEIAQNRHSGFIPGSISAKGTMDSCCEAKQRFVRVLKKTNNAYGIASDAGMTLWVWLWHEKR